VVNDTDQTAGLTPKAPFTPICTLRDAWIAWQSGAKFPIGFLGDSTTDGAGTTSGASHARQDTEAGGFGKVDYINTYAYSYLLQQLIRQETGSTVARVYNIGYSGTTFKWAKPKLEAIFSEAYADVKMVGIVYGINDRLVNTVAEYERVVREHLEYFIAWFYNRGIQPFLVTPQATVEPSTATSYIGQYPLRSSEALSSIAHPVIRELACKYSLELIDMAAFDELALTYSRYPLTELCPDTLHFGDRGHQLAAGFLFSWLCPRVIEVKSDEMLTFTSQKLRSSVASDKVTYINPAIYGFKIKAEYEKTDTDMLLQDFWILNSSKGRFSLTAYATTAAGYVIVDGMHTNLTATEQLVSDSLDIGLHHIQVYSGAGAKVGFLGMKLTKIDD
jgi:lysophospholipase L1-like esterase